jgi:hypothetical protein
MIRVDFNDPALRSSTARAVIYTAPVLFNVRPFNAGSGSTPLVGASYALDISTETLVVPGGTPIRELKFEIARAADPIDIRVEDALGAVVARHRVVAARDVVGLSPATGATILFETSRNEAYLFWLEIT